MADILLDVHKIRAGHGHQSIVLDGVSLQLVEGGSMSLLGRNGVGKSTLLLTVMGYTDVRSGTIEWRGRNITWMAPHHRARNGLGWVPQERDIFASLTVEENLTVAARPGRWDVTAIYELFPRLGERRAHKGNHLSGGEQQMLSIARTLTTNPSLLLLDEPLEGLAPIIADELAGAIRRMIAEEKIAVILVEQHAELALRLTETTMVLDRGTIVYQGHSKDLLADRPTLDRLIGLKLS